MFSLRNIKKENFEGKQKICVESELYIKMNENTAVEMERNNSQFDENLPYIEYSISGFRGSVISGEERRFHVESDDRFGGNTAGRG